MESIYLGFRNVDKQPIKLVKNVISSIKSLCTDSETITKSIYYLNVGASLSVGEKGCLRHHQKVTDFIFYKLPVFIHWQDIKIYTYRENTSFTRQKRCRYDCLNGLCNLHIHTVL
jgi:hypothetical protein